MLKCTFLAGYFFCAERSWHFPSIFPASVISLPINLTGASGVRTSRLLTRDALPSESLFRATYPGPRNSLILPTTPSRPHPFACYPEAKLGLSVEQLRNQSLATSELQCEPSFGWNSSPRHNKHHLTAAAILRDSFSIFRKHSHQLCRLNSLHQRCFHNTDPLGSLVSDSGPRGDKQLGN